MINKFKNNLDKVLIILGLVLFLSFGLYTKINNISTDNTWVAYLGMVICGTPLFCGLWLLSNKIRERKRAVSRIIKIFIIFYCVAFVIPFSIKTIEAFAPNSGSMFDSMGTSLDKLMTETPRNDLLNGFLVYSLVFVSLGAFLLYKSKRRTEHNKGLSKFLKIISVFWIVTGSLSIVAILIEKLLN